MAPKLPSPLPSSTEIELAVAPLVATTKSCLPSPFTSQIAIAEQHRDSSRVGIHAGARRNEVGLAVAVQVADRHEGRKAASRRVVGLDSETPVAVAQQHRNRV